MTLRFVLGRAGSGKTHCCLEEILQQLLNSRTGKEKIFLAPEQSTFQLEQALANLPGLTGTLGIQVLSFRRLAWRVLSETGGASRVPIGELGKGMVLRNLLNSQRDKLTVFRSSSKRFGFIDTLAGTLGEMKNYCITPNELKGFLQKVDEGQGLLRAKLADLQIIYEQLGNFLAEKYTDPDDYLAILARRLVDSPTLKGAEIWVDGFTGFTPQEYQVLKGLITTAGRVTMALCLDPVKREGEIAEEDLFYPTGKTYRDLLEVAGEAGVEIETPLLLGPDRPRFRLSANLGYLEKNFFSQNLPEPAEADGAIKLTAAANPRAEVEGAARELIRLSRDLGFRWRESSILIRDLALYDELITTVFEDHGIPFFIDRKKNVMHHPLVELVRSALEVAVGDWPYEAVFRFLKTDLIPVSRNRIDSLENYVLAHGIRGSKWTEQGDWVFRRPYGLGEKPEISGEEGLELAVINETRQEAAKALGEFVQRVRAGRTARDFTAALYAILEELGVYETLNQWSSEALEAGALSVSREHLQVWGSLMGLFDELVEALGEEEMPLENYLEILDAGLENLKVGLIPPGLDQVFVGSLDRSRGPEVKAAFVLGVNDGVLPARVINQGLFNDAERETLEKAGICLAPGSRRKTFDEQYLVYKALTRAGEYLWISYPVADDEGRSLVPSPVIGRLREMFPDLRVFLNQVEPFGSEEELEYLALPKPSLAYLAAGLREARSGSQIKELWWDVYNWFAREELWREEGRKVLAGLFHINQEKPVPGVLSRKLYGQPFGASISRIERYKACPFAHFAAYGLRLKEREIYKLAAPDMGEFLHAALKGFADYLARNNLDWGQLDREQCGEISGKVVDELTPKLQREILLSSARYRYIAGKLKKITIQAAVSLAEYARRGVFRPVGLELAFGPQEDLPPLNIQLSEGILALKGRIDRIDMAVQGDKVYFRVIDYKSRDNGLKIPEIYHGLKLQLLAYLHLVLCHGSELAQKGGTSETVPLQALPGGMLYFTLKEPVISSSGPREREDVEAEIRKQLKMNGYLLGDPEVVRLMDNQLESGWSDLFKVGLKGDQNFHKNSQVITAEQFGFLRKHLEHTLMEAGEEIIRGQARIEPYRHKNTTACIYCSYKAVCKFDLTLEGNSYKELRDPDEDTLWKTIRGKEGYHEGAPVD